MVAQKGSLVLLKVGNGQPVESFITLGGLRTTRLMLNSQAVNASNKDSGAWRMLLAGAGIRSLSMTGHGIFTNAASEALIRGYAFAGSIQRYRLTFGNGDSLTGPFQITSYERAGEYDGEETYSVTLESAGVVEFVGG
jgi:TP901-1 family phage major tail protein